MLINPIMSPTNHLGGIIKMCVLKADNIKKIYGGRGNASATNALNGVSIQVEKGEFVGVMGPSGSGKSTLMSILGGITSPTNGTVEIAKKSITHMDSDRLALFRRREIGFVFQDFNLLDSLTIKENIMLPMILDKKKADYIENRVEEIMDMFDISHISNKYPYSVSGGQQQRTAVSRALVNNPAIVFADEPTGNLDSKSSNAVMRCFDKMNKDEESTILMVTHDPFAASFCKRIVFIKDGLISLEITKKDNRKQFFDRILDCLAVLGGDRSEI